MTFPTSGEFGSFSRMLRFQDLAARIVTLRPDLKEQISTDAPDLVRIGLSERPNGRRPLVVLALLREVRSGACWLITAPPWTPGGTVLWELETDPAVLARATVAMYAAAEAEQRPESPWRWAEATTTDVVRVADDLLVRGLDVVAVVDGNREVPDRVEGFKLRRLVAAAVGPALRMRVDQATATLACKPTLGWVLDYQIGEHVHRLDLAAAITGETSRSPGFRTDDLGHVAQAVTDTLSRAPVDSRPGRLGAAGLDADANSLPHAAAAWLRELGYPDARTEDVEAAVHTHAAHVALSARRNGVGIGELKAAYADAALAGRRLFMFSRAGYTGPARAWADRAGAALFTLAAGADRPGAASELAREHLPAVI